MWIIWIIAPLLAAGPSLPIEGPGGPAGALLGWLLAHKKAGPKADGDRLRQVLQDGETVRLDGGHRSAAARFGALILDPAYADLAGTSDYDNVRYHLASAWLADGAVGKARRLLLEMVGRKPQSDFRAPAFRKLMDLTHGSRQHEQTLSALAGMSISPSQDENDEIAYLKGKALLHMGYADQALEALSAVTRTSRQYAAATYLAGIAELKRGAEAEAEDRFCKLVSDASARAAPGQTRFFLSESAVRVVEHTWLALARLRHDRGEYERAWTTYQKVSQGGQAHRAARYESTWSLYRTGDLAGAREALRELLASGETLPDRPTAQLLLGYAMLGDCLFDQASVLFTALEREQAALAAALADPASDPAIVPRLARPWLPHGTEEQDLDRLYLQIQDGAERTVWLRAELDRVASGMPRKTPRQPKRDLTVALKRDLSRAHSLKQRLADLRARLGTAENEQSKLQQLRKLQTQVDDANGRAQVALERLRHSELVITEVAPAGRSLPTAYLDAERREVAKIDKTFASQFSRARVLMAQASKAWSARSTKRLAAWTRQANLGRVDAVIGKKQALETEVQNLALGRYPLSLLRQLAEAGLLDDSYEYWPYDGETWPDEYE